MRERMNRWTSRFELGFWGFLQKDAKVAKGEVFGLGFRGFVTEGIEDREGGGF